jgi:hypothetical protein
MKVVPVISGLTRYVIYGGQINTEITTFDGQRVFKLFAEEIEEALMQYLVERAGAHYDGLAANKPRITNRCSMCGKAVESDLKCSTATLVEDR